MTPDEIKEYIDMVGKKDKYEIEGLAKINLFGYTSCSLTKNTALSFAWENKKSGHQKVLLHIKWKSPYHSAYFLNGGAYDHEEEVLLMDGTRVTVDSVEEVKDENNQVLYTLISLRFIE